MKIKRITVKEHMKQLINENMKMKEQIFMQQQRIQSLEVKLRDIKGIYGMQMVSC